MTIRTPNNSYYVSGASGGQDHTLPFGADRFEDDDLFVYVWNTSTEVWDKKTVTTHYTVSSTQVSFTSGNIPSTRVIVLRKTDVDEDFPKADFVAGASIKAQDLDNNQLQALRGIKELRDQKLSAVPSIAEDGTPSNPKMYANLDMNGYKVINQPVGYITSTDILDGTIATADVADSAITAAKLASDSITTAKIASDAVNGTKIADDSIDSEHYVDGSIDTAHIADAQITTAKIANDAVTAAKLADDAVVTANIVDANVTTAKIADSAVTTAKIADAELVELATMGGNTASALADLTQAEVQILDGATVTTAELNILDGVTATATELNQLDGNTLKTTGTDFTSSSEFPAASEIDARITARIDPLGGFEAIADEDSFPATAPPEGTVISIANANSLAVNSSGVGAGTRAGGSDAVVINGFPSTFNSTSLDDGIGLLVVATSTAHTYNFHRVVAKNEDVRQLSSDINDFKARYRIGSSNPTTDNDAGDLFFNTGTSKMLVRNAGNTAWQEVQAVGDFFINTLSSSSGTGGGSATFNGTAYRFTLSNAPTYAQQLLVSINGVVQKPNSGTSQPSEGFALDGSDIILAAAPASGADSFFITIGSSVGIGTPSDNTVSTAKIVDGAVTNAKVNSSAAIDGTKISPNFGSQNVVTTGSVGIGTTSPGGALDVVAGNTSNYAITANNSNSSGDQNFLQLKSGSTVIGDFNRPNGTNNVEFNVGYGAVAFGTGSSGTATEKVRIDSAGNVGIGTSSPGTKLDVNDGSANCTIRARTGTGFSSFLNLLPNGSGTGVQLASNADSSAQLFNQLNGHLTFGTNNTERLRIDSSGRVGIGTASPTTPLTVQGDTSANSVRLLGRSSDDRADLQFYENDGSTFIASLSAQSNSLNLFLGSSSGELKITGNQTLFRSETGTERIRINGSGQLLVGTSTARSVQSFAASGGQLQIEGTSYQSSSASFINNQNVGDGPYLLLGKSRGTSLGSNTIVQSGDGLGSIWFNGADGSGLKQGAIISSAVDGTPGSNDMPGRLMFNTTSDGSSSPTERMRIDSSGNVAIGTTTASTKLDVEGNGVPVEINSANSNSNKVQLSDAGTIRGYFGASSTASFLVSGDGGSEQLRVQAAGGISFNGDTAQANALDDYEEGTWSATLSYGTCTTTDAKYIKIGNVVRINATLSGFSDRSSSAGLQITNAPFASNGGQNAQAAGANIHKYLGLAANISYMSSSGNIEFYAATTGNWSQLAYNDLSSNASTIYFFAQYQIN